MIFTEGLIEPRGKERCLIAISALDEPRHAVPPSARRRNIMLRRADVWTSAFSHSLVYGRLKVGSARADDELVQNLLSSTRRFGPEAVETTASAITTETSRPPCPGVRRRLGRDRPKRYREM